MDTGKNIQYLMRPSSIALLGCSEKNVGGQTLKNLLSNGYAGKIYPVHPKNETVCGVKCYKSLAEIPGDVDCCLVALRSTLCEAAVDEMEAKGVRAAVFLASGFSEVGAEGRALQKRLTEKLRASGIAACGPNCLGFINFHDNVLLYSAATDISHLKGPVGLVSHSGSICIAFQSARRGAGYSYHISCGNEAGLSVPDYFRAMIEDEHTEIIVGFLEAVRDPDGLKEAAKLAVERNKPIIVLKVGRSEIAQQTASAHSGALASSANVSDAFFKQNHILQVNSFDELNEACELLLKLKDVPLTGPAKIGMTAISGGQLGFCSDVAEEQGLTFAKIGEEAKSRIRAALPDFATAKNPLDVTTALFDTDAYQACIRALAADPETGLLLICQDCEANMCEEEIALYRHIVKALCQVRGEISKPMAVFSPLSAGVVPEYTELLAAHGIPLLQGAHESMRAVSLYFQWMRSRAALAVEKTAERCEKIPVDMGTGRTLSERASKAVLSAYGIPVAADILADSREAAADAGEKIGWPVVMKIDSADILHKTEAKAVKLGISSREEAAWTYDELMANARAYNPSARINGVSVQETVDRGVEMMLGMKLDPVFGPCVLAGVGGIFVEIFKDVSLRLAPVDHETALEMVESLKGKQLLYGARGAEPADVEALCDTIVRFSRLAWDYRDQIEEMDINPLIVLEKGKGVKAADGLILLREPS